MLRKTADEEGKDWDRLLPYVLFAYREVPQESTGYSPFELLYGREVRGPLDVMKESWESSKSTDESILWYLIRMREKFEKTSSLVEANLSKAQAKQKHWYDKSARQRHFQEGDYVLILLPTSTSKFTAQWQGKEVGEEESEEEILTWDGGEEGEPKLGDQLTAVQRAELRGLLKKFEGVLQKLPGKTELAEHTIYTGDTQPVRLPPYRISQAYRQKVEGEIKEMLANDIIQPSSSEWAAPMVIVKKKDGSLRICVDYRKLNSGTRVDAYPMPRISDLIDQLGLSKYITTLDLTKGYWQVPVAEEDRPSLLPLDYMNLRRCRLVCREHRQPFNV